MLAVNDLEKSLAFFTEKLGFTLTDNYGDPPYVATIERDGTGGLTLLRQPGVIVPDGHIVTLSFTCTGIDELYAEFIAHGVEMEEEIDNKLYGIREFHFKDPDGHVLYFQQKVAENTPDN